MALTSAWSFSSFLTDPDIMRAWASRWAAGAEGYLVELGASAPPVAASELVTARAASRWAGWYSGLARQLDVVPLEVWPSRLVVGRVPDGGPMGWRAISERAALGGARPALVEWLRGQSDTEGLAVRDLEGAPVAGRVVTAHKWVLAGYRAGRRWWSLRVRRPFRGLVLRRLPTAAAPLSAFARSYRAELARVWAARRRDPLAMRLALERVQHNPTDEIVNAFRGWADGLPEVDRVELAGRAAEVGLSAGLRERRSGAVDTAHPWREGGVVIPVVITGAPCSAEVVTVTGSPAARMRRFGELAVEGAREGRVVELARGLSSAGDPRTTAARILRHVQSLPYREDAAAAVDVVRHPCTVLSSGGDCEDLAVLVCSLDLAAGLGARLRWLSQPEVLQDHVTAQCRLSPGGEWFWQEPTLPGAELGENPYRAAGRLGVRGAL